MSDLLERPEVIEKRPPVIASPPPERQGPVRDLRWLGWLLAAGAVVLIAVLAIIATNSDDTVSDRPDHLIEAPAATSTPVYLPRSVADVTDEVTVTPAMGSRLVEHAPGFVEEPVITFMEEATLTPGLIVLDGSDVVVDPAPRTSVRLPVTEFMDEATVTPAMGSRLVEHAPGFVDHPVVEHMDEATVTPGLVQSGAVWGGQSAPVAL